ncbi:MAG: thioredoxin family protein [Cyclobacteriaceae bacterium]
MNRLTLTFLATLFFASSCLAQDWHTDFDQAVAQAKTTNSPIILVFQGSDWCAPCIRLDREVWGTDIFKTYAADHYIMLQADFPRKKQNALTEAQQQANNQLAERYNPNGIFPFVIVLDQEGKILLQTGYKGMSPEEYIAHLESYKS